jgi:hypothetical protein
VKVQHFNGNVTRYGTRAESKAKNGIMDIVANSRRILLSSFATGFILHIIDKLSSAAAK